MRACLKDFCLVVKRKKKWVLNYLLTAKRTISYEMMTRYDSLNIRPEDGKFFQPH